MRVRFSSPAPKLCLRPAVGRSWGPRRHAVQPPGSRARGQSERTIGIRTSVAALPPDRPLWAVGQVDYFQRGLQASEVAAVPGQQHQAVSRCGRGDLQVHAARPRVAAALAHETGQRPVVRVISRTAPRTVPDRLYAPAPSNGSLATATASCISPSVSADTATSSATSVPMSSGPIGRQSSRTTFLVARPDTAAAGRHAGGRRHRRHGTATHAMEVSVLRRVQWLHTIGGATATAAQS